MNSDCVREPDARFLRLLMSCTGGDLIEIEHSGGYYVGQLVRVGAYGIVIAPQGKRPSCGSKAMVPEEVYDCELPLGRVIGFENRGQRYARIPKVSAL